MEGRERRLCCVTHGRFRAPEGDDRTDKVRFWHIYHQMSVEFQKVNPSLTTWFFPWGKLSESTLHLFSPPCCNSGKLVMKFSQSKANELTSSTSLNLCVWVVSSLRHMSSLSLLMPAFWLTRLEHSSVKLFFRVCVYSMLTSTLFKVVWKRNKTITFAIIFFLVFFATEWRQGGSRTTSVAWSRNIHF